MTRFLLSVLPLLLFTAALAQPDLGGRGMGKNVPPTSVTTPISQDTPLNAVRYFLSSLGEPDKERFAQSVAGARVDYHSDDIWKKARMEAYPFVVAGKLAVDDVMVDSQTNQEATVTLKVHKGYGANHGDKCTLQLRREVVLLPGGGEGQEVWRVVPLSTKAVLKGPLLQLPLFSLTATLALRDPHLIPLLQKCISISQLNQLGIGVMQFTWDHKEIYAFDDAAPQRALKPYLSKDQLFSIIGTKDEKWHFNNRLAHKSLALVAEPGRTVLFYDGAAPSTQNLHFRFGGKTVICFADGHVASFSKDELPKLIWKP